MSAKNESLIGDNYASEYYKSEKGYVWTNFGHADQELIDKCHEHGVNKSFEHGVDDRGKPFWWRWSKYKYTDKESGEERTQDNIFKNTLEEHEAFLAKYKKGGSAQVSLSPPRDLPVASLKPSSTTDNPITDSPKNFPQYIFVALKGLTDTDGLDSIKNWRQAGWTEEEYTTIRNPKGLGVVMKK